MSDIHEYDQIWEEFRKQKMTDEVKQREYYEGFNVGKERIMFQEELKDIESTYRGALEMIEAQIEERLPSLLNCMEDFITLNREKEKVSEKLCVLLCKTGSYSKKKEEGEDHE